MTKWLDEAKDILGLETLETRGRDGLDFVELPVWKIKAALIYAREVGRDEFRPKPKKRAVKKTEDKIRKLGAKAYYDK